MAKHRVAFDKTTGHVGCVLIQAGLGGESLFVSANFDPSEWALMPTPGMELYTIRDTELPQVREYLRQVREHRV